MFIFSLYFWLDFSNFCCSIRVKICFLFLFLSPFVFCSGFLASGPLLFLFFYCASFASISMCPFWKTGKSLQYFEASPATLPTCIYALQRQRYITRRPPFRPFYHLVFSSSRLWRYSRPDPCWGDAFLSSLIDFVDKDSLIRRDIGDLDERALVLDNLSHYLHIFRRLEN